MQTIGERLEEARKRKGISIREAAEATKIRGDYLQKFENNQFDLNLADLYVRGFLRGYASFLKLPADKIINDYNSLGTGTRTPRAPSREVYGRMELSVASSDDEEEDSGNSEDEKKPAAARAPFRRSGGGMPPGPAIDPDLVLKGGIALVGLVIVGLVIWGIMALLSGPPAAETATGGAAGTPPAQAAQAELQEYVLVALEPVTIQAWREDPGPPPDYGPLVYSGNLERGRTLRLPTPGPYIVIVSDPAHIAIEAGNQRLTAPLWGNTPNFRLP